MTDAIKDLRVQVRAWNNQLRERREALGLSTVQLAEQLGLSYQWYLGVEGLKIKPIDLRPGREGWKPGALRLAEFYGVTPEILFPDLVLKIEAVTAERRVDAEEMVAMTLPSASTPLQLLESNEVEVALQGALERLTEKERRVLEMRFGVNGEGEGQGWTLDQVAHEFGVTRERIRQIEVKALRKLRHPSQHRLHEAAGWA